MRNQLKKGLVCAETELGHVFLLLKGMDKNGRLGLADFLTQRSKAGKDAKDSIFFAHPLFTLCVKKFN